MWTYAVKRILAGMMTALLCSVAIFLIIRAVPGDIVGQMLGQSGGAGSAVSERALRSFFGLDQPLHQQYLGWLGGVLRGDFGRSWTQGRLVTTIVTDAFLVTLEIGLLTLFFATLIGVPLGLVAGIYEGRVLDNLIQGFNVIGLSAPVFWVGLMLLIGASVYLAWGPPIVYMSPDVSLADNLQILALPVASLTLLQAAAYSQFVRQSVVSTAHQEFVRTAVAKGLPLRTVYFKHIFRNILIPLVTFMGLILIQILGGVVVTESLFALPGIGRLLVTSIQSRDYPVVQGALVLIVAVAILINLLVDLLYHVIDPRMRK